MSREQTQNKIYFNANISLRQHSTGQKCSQQPRPGTPSSGTSDTQRVPSGATAGAGPAAEGYGWRRSPSPGLSASQLRRCHPWRHSPLSYDLIDISSLESPESVFRWHQPGVRSRLLPSASATLATCVPEQWARACDAVRSAKRAPPTCWGRVQFRWRAQQRKSSFIAKTVQHWYFTTNVQDVRRLQKHKHGDTDATAWQRCRWCTGPIN